MSIDGELDRQIAQESTDDAGVENVDAQRAWAFSLDQASELRPRDRLDAKAGALQPDGKARYPTSGPAPRPYLFALVPTAGGPRCQTWTF